MSIEQPVHLGQPTTMVLTEAGSSYFVRRNQRLQRFRLISGREEFGMQLRDYRPNMLETLISRGLVRTLQYPVADAVAERHDVVAFVSGVAAGFLSFHVADAGRTMLEASEVFRRWRRSYPRSAIGSPETAAAIDRVLHGRRREAQHLQGLMATRVRSILRTRADLVVDRERVDPALAGVVAQIPPEAWFFLVANPTGSAERALFDSLAAVVADAVPRTELGDYLALVWVELITHLQHRECADPPSQVHLLSLFEGLGDSAAAPRGGGRHRLHMMAATGDAPLDLLRADLDHISDATRSGTRTFDQFYQSVDAGSTQLGLYYLGFLEDACRRLNVGYRAWVQGQEDGGRLNLVVSL